MKLYEYQKIGANWLAQGKYRLLADEMGLGKTLQAIEATRLIGAKKILIVCPPIARLTWQREFLKWGSKLNVRVIEKRNEKLSATDQVVIVGFDYVVNNFSTLSKSSFDLLIVDESHFIKGMEAKRTQSILGREGIIHATKRAWFLTGTPMPNHPGELWPLLFTTGATKLSYADFVDYYCTWYEHLGRKCITGARRVRLPELRSSLNSVMLRRETASVLPDLPSVRVQEVRLEPKLTALTPQLAEEFEMLKQYLMKMERTPEQMLAALSVVAGSVSTLRRYCSISKVEPLAALIKEELENKTYEKIVIFGVHREALASLSNALQQHGVARIDGSINAAERQRAIDSFQSDPKCQIFIGNIQAAGTNITLTASHHVIFLEQSWVPGDNQQAIARCARIGQKNSVFVRYCTLANTIDEKVQEILASKSFDIEELLKVSA